MFDSPPVDIGREAIELSQKETAEKVLTAFRNGLTDPAQVKQLTEAGQNILRDMRQKLSQDNQRYHRPPQISFERANLVPQNLVPQNLVPQNLVPQNLVPQNLVPQNLVPQNPSRPANPLASLPSVLPPIIPPIPPPPSPTRTMGQRLLGGAQAVGGVWNTLSTVSSTLSGPMRQGAGMVNTINNASLSSSQMDERLADSIPVIGELISSFRSLRDAVDGTAEEIRAEGVEQENRLMRERNRAARESELQPRRLELASAQNTVNVLRGASASAYTAEDRSTGRGAIDYGISQQRLVARDNIDAARRRAEMSGRDVVAARNQLPGLDAQIRQAERDRTAAARDVRTIRGRGSDVTSSRNRADELAALNRVEEANARIINLNNQRRAASESVTQAEIRNANDLSAVRQRNIDQLRTEMQILQQREQSMSSSAQRFGMTTEFEQDTAIQFAEIARTEGIGALLPEQRQLVQQMFPQFASGELERFGEQSRGYQYGRDVLGEFGSEARGQSIADTRGSVDRLQAEVRNNIIIDERELATQIAASLGPAMERLVRTIESEARARTSEMVRGRLTTIATGGS